MRKYFLILAMAIFSTGLAQDKNVNETKETQKTKTTIKTKKGKKVYTRKDQRRAEKDIELQNPDKKRVNYKVKKKPFKVDREISYSSEGTAYSFTPDEKGFTISKRSASDKKQPFAKVRRTKNDGYYIMILNNNKETSFGRFDRDGNLIMERYDPEKDEVVKETYTRDK